MSKPTLTPASQTSAIVLPVTGTHSDVTAALAYGIYTTDDFVSGAVDQVAYTYKRLGGDVLDIEITAGNVYADYEMAVLEYSYIVNTHQAKNVLSDLLGTPTGTFDEDGTIKSGTLSGTLDGIGAEMRYPLFEFSYARRVADGIGQEIAVGGNHTLYSASIKMVNDQQEYNLQDVLLSGSNDDLSGKDAATGEKPAYHGKIGTADDHIKVKVQKVYYKTPNSMWRFYGYYGGLNAVGNLSNYGQWTDDSTFEVIPTWQNKLQSMAFEDAIWTRNSHFSYELTNNMLKLYPIPNSEIADYIWFTFSIPEAGYVTGSSGVDSGIMGVNNMNTLPFQNIEYQYINSIGKQWIRRFALALSKETLGQVRSKFGNNIPIPGESLSLNGTDLLGQAKEEQEKLREELKTVLDELTYTKIAEDDKAHVDAVEGLQTKIPLKIFVG